MGDMPEEDTDNKLEESREYTLVPILSQSHINPGEDIEISLFLSGFAENDAELDDVKNKLFVTFPGEILDNEEAGYWQNSVNIDQSSQQIIIDPGERSIDQIEIEEDTSGIGHALHPGFFAVREGPSTPFGMPPILAESAHDKIPPLKLVLKTADKIPAGNYPIHFIFTYSKGEVKQDKQTVNIHVNSWAEKHKKILQLLGGIGASAAVVSLIVTAADTLHFI